MNANVEAIAITTADNPYDPVDDYDHWLQFDRVHQYGTDCWLARICRTSDSLSDYENLEEIENAIDQMIADDPFKGSERELRKIVKNK